MAKDQRLYMTFPNDFWMHPKVAPRSVEAKWAFVEMNGYSRMQDLDGRIPSVMALRLWSIEVLDELVASHPTRPLVMLDGDTYVIRDYDKHQQTTADREALSQVRAEAGRRGRAKQLSGTSPANAGQVSGQIRAESETESETKEASLLGEGKLKETRLPADWVPSKAHYDLAKTNRLNLPAEVESFRLHAETHDRHAARWNAAFTTWLKKAKPMAKGGGSDWALKL